MRTRETNDCEAQENVRGHPGPVIIPAVEHSQDEAKPDPIERDGPRARVADEEEECWRGKTADDAPPAGVFHEEVAEMPDRDEEDCGGLQPVGIVHRGRHAFRARRIVDVERIASVFLVPRHGAASKKKRPPRRITGTRCRDRGNWAPRRRSGGGLAEQVLVVFRASATGNDPYFPWSCAPTRPADVGAFSLNFDDVGDPVDVFTRVTEPRKGGTGRLIFGDRAPCIRDSGGAGFAGAKFSVRPRDRSCATFSRQRTSASGVAAPS